MNFESRTRDYVMKAMASASKYEQEKVVTDWLRKDEVAPKIVEDFTKRAGNPAGKRVLDVGFGNGMTAAAFAASGANISGLEVSEDLLNFGRDVFVDRGLSGYLELYDGTHFPFADNSFDYAYSVSSLEHMSEPQEVLAEIARVLKPGGKFYLAFPNRLNPKETHTGLWFISYLPIPIASWIAERFGRSPFEAYWNLHFISYFGLRRMLKRGRIPLFAQFEASGQGWKGLLKRALAKVGIHHSALLQHVMVVLKKL